MSSNRITDILPKAFNLLPQLRILDISKNALETLSPNFVEGVPHLEVLSLVANSLHAISLETVLSMQEFGVKTDDNRICCSLVLVYCMTKGTCFSLLESRNMKGVLLLTFILVFLVNTLSFVKHLKLYTHSFDGYRLFIRTSPWGNLLHGIYLCSLWAVQEYFSDNFVLEHIRWRQSGFCFKLFVVSLWHALFSPLIFCLLALARLMVVLHPLNTKFKRSSFVLQFLLLCCLLSVTISASLGFIQWLLYHLIPFEFCSPLVDFSETFSLIKYAAMILCFYQLSGTGFVCITHSLLVVNLKISQKVISGLHDGKSTFLRRVCTQAIASTASDIVSRIPSNIIILLGLLDEKFDPSLIKWCIILLCSMSSILHPLVHTAASLRKKAVLTGLQTKQLHLPNIHSK